MKQKVLVVNKGIWKEEVELVSTGDEVEWLVIVVAEGQDEVGLELKVVHKGPKTKGVMWVRGVVRGEARVRVVGTAELCPSAAGSESMVRQEMLLVSPRAVVDSRPELLIKTNDVVSAMHAATVGMIDRNMVMYLQSRGVDVKEAEEMIAGGFLLAMVEKISDVEVRARVLREVGLS